MISIFAVPKPFQGHTGIIQTNAILSWKKMDNCEIILMGNDKGVRRFCIEHNFKHIPEIETNKYGTPLISSIFKTAEYKAKHNTLAYVNSDIILFNSFKECIKSITYEKYLICDLLFVLSWM